MLNKNSYLEFYFNTRLYVEKILFRLPGEFRCVLRSDYPIRVKFNIPMLFGSDMLEGRQVHWDKYVQDLEFYDNTNFTKWYSVNEEVLAGRAVVEEKAGSSSEVLNSF